MGDIKAINLELEIGSNDSILSRFTHNCGPMLKLRLINIYMEDIGVFRNIFIQDCCQRWFNKRH